MRQRQRERGRQIDTQTDRDGDKRRDGARDAPKYNFSHKFSRLILEMCISFPYFMLVYPSCAEQGNFFTFCLKFFTPARLFKINEKAPRKGPFQKCAIFVTKAFRARVTSKPVFPRQRQKEKKGFLEIGKPEKRRLQK